MSTETRLKVGQTVKITQEGNPHSGKIGTVIHDDSTDYFPYKVSLPDGSRDIYCLRHLEPCQKTLKDLAEGEIVIDDDEDEVKVLGVIRPGLYVLSTTYDHKQVNNTLTAEEMEEDGWKVKEETTEQVVKTVEELEKELKLAPGTLRIKGEEAA